MKNEKLLVYVNSATLGRGDDTLGDILIRSFLYSVKELNPKPWRIIFINSGVKLVAEASKHLDILKEIEESGVEIMSCGTCIDYFKLKDKLKAGKITNMAEIASSFVEATKVISP